MELSEVDTGSRSLYAAWTSVIIAQLLARRRAILPAGLTFILQENQVAVSRCVPV